MPVRVARIDRRPFAQTEATHDWSLAWTGAMAFTRMLRFDESASNRADERAHRGFCCSVEDSVQVGASITACNALDRSKETTRLHADAGRPHTSRHPADNRTQPCGRKGRKTQHLGPGLSLVFALATDNSRRLNPEFLRSSRLGTIELRLRNRPSPPQDSRHSRLQF